MHVKRDNSFLNIITLIDHMGIIHVFRQRKLSDFYCTQLVENIINNQGIRPDKSTYNCKTSM